MRQPYTYAVLRYRHDAATGEFVNVGVVVYSPEARFLGAECLPSMGRVSTFFGGAVEVDAEHFRRTMRDVERGVAELADHLFKSLFGEPPADLLACVRQVLPADDTALQVELGGAGTAENMATALTALYSRLVTRYLRRVTRDARSDEDVEAEFQRELRSRDLIGRLQPKTIVAPDYEHEFRYAWKNEVWHTVEALSLDLLQPAQVVEKANKWLGRGVNLHESQEPFVLHLLLGRPAADGGLQDAYTKAVNILKKMPMRPDVVPEDRAGELAERARADVEAHAHDGEGQPESS